MTWNRATRSHPCKACGKPDWCGYTADGAVRCMRTDVPPEGYRLVKSDPHGGNVFVAGDGAAWQPRRQAKAKPKKPQIDWSGAQVRFINALTDELSAQLEAEIGVGDPWITLFGIGWSKNHQAWTFPMRDHMARVVGIRLRTPEGRKLAIRGSSEGLFMPEIKAMDTHEVLIAEGPTDTMHLWSLGFITIGRPSCRGASEFCKQFVGSRSAVIVSDKDSPGRAGANDLAGKLADRAGSVKVIEPLYGKDAREWIERGATADEIRVVIDSAKEQANDTQQVPGGFA